MATSETREYYERTQFLYNWLWSKQALSYGLWARDTRSVAAAIENQFQYVRSLLDVTGDDHLLDLGCGTGGCAIRLAQLTGCRVTGLTLSSRQIAQAKATATAAGVDQRVSFQRVDFERPLPFAEHAFTKAYSVEALCYAVDKTAVLREVFRVVSPRGRLLVLDGFLQTVDLSPDQVRSYQTCLVGWRVPGLAEQSQFTRDVQSAGFESVQRRDATSQVIPASDRIRRIGQWLWPLTWSLSALRIIPQALHENTLTMIEQRRAFGSYAFYGVVTAVKD